MGPLPSTPDRLVTILGVLVLAAAAIAVGIGGWPTVVPPDDPDTDTDPAGLTTFTSAAEFRAYVAGNDGGGGFGGLFGRPVAFAAEGDAGSTSAEPRYSGTNVQEVGIGEPDLLKTDGRHIYYSPMQGHVVGPEPRPTEERADTQSGTTWLVDADDPAAPTIRGSVNTSGQLFLLEDTLVVLEGTSVIGYDVTTPESPVRIWENQVGGRVVTAREIDGTVYLVVQQRVDRAEPCPIEPYGTTQVSCTEIYRPTEPTPADTTVSVVAIEPSTGALQDSVTVVGSDATSAVYASDGGIYLTYPRHEDRAETLIDYLRSADGREHLDAHTIERLDKLAGYDLSPQARQIEARSILEAYYRSLHAAEAETVRSTIEGDYEAYLSEHKREFTRTGIVRIAITGNGALSVGATGSVPGRVLNQFSMDEHEGHLRIATTVPAVGTESENDLYVLDPSLEIRGSVQGMGLNEQIYSVRYVGDRGYVVTFRRIDPFHVLDLSDPTDPTLEGELKLPGFSSYLHPLGPDRILGIGEEDGRVKAVTFDVSTPSDPAVEDDLILPDRWSAISQSHHAFLQDERHEIVFVPGNEGGHVISYADGELQEVMTVATPGAPNRALYIDDYLYVFSPRGLVVVDETDWRRVTTLEFSG